ncbi:kinase-like domain-containing protein [Globomyces pollinis-pini]|nr:kinase-like domain-containing protein [Globomyces pollinis-pini]
MKRISKRKSTTENTVYFIFRERSILQSLRHQGVVMLRYAFQDNDSLYMIYDHSPINFRSIMTKDCMKDPITRMYAAEIALALDYLHQNFITHRDLTPENILIDSSGHVLVSNFSFAISIKQTTPKHAIGSPTYMAPEMSSKKPYRYAVDWWSFGIILFECTYGQVLMLLSDSYRPHCLKKIHLYS